MVEPPLLVWARESFGYDLDQAAQKIGVSTKRLASWEHGEEKPSISQLRKIASVYKRPIAVFYLPEPPRTFDAMRDFRRLPEDEREHFSPELLLEFRRARERREGALDLMKELGEEPKEFALRFQMTENPKAIAQKTREWLGVSFEQQIAWKTPYEALNYWVSSLENLGVLVFQASKISIGQMRGFAISETVLPVIVLNGQDTPRGRIFSLFHELTHLFLNQTGVSDAEERFTVQSEEDQIEVFCNRVAGEVLVPADRLLQEKAVIAKRDLESWSDEELKQLADTFMVSREVILRRLIFVRKTTARFYEQKRNEFLMAYKEAREASGTGFVPYPKLVVRNLGSYFVKLVLDAYYNDVITSSDLSDYLHIKIDNLGKIEQEVIGGSLQMAGGA